MCHMIVGGEDHLPPGTSPSNPVSLSRSFYGLVRCLEISILVFCTIFGKRNKLQLCVRKSALLQIIIIEEGDCQYLCNLRAARYVGVHEVLSRKTAESWDEYRQILVSLSATGCDPVVAVDQTGHDCNGRIDGDQFHNVSHRRDLVLLLVVDDLLGLSFINNRLLTVDCYGLPSAQLSTRKAAFIQYATKRFKDRLLHAIGTGKGGVLDKVDPLEDLLSLILDTSVKKEEGRVQSRT